MDSFTAQDDARTPSRRIAIADLQRTRSAAPASRSTG